MPQNNNLANSSVLILKCDTYDQARVDAAIQAVFNHLGGIKRFIKTGDNVLLKVNLLGSYLPEKRVTTDPAIVSAVARAVIDAGGHPVIADSPGIDNFKKSAETSGLAAIARELGISCIELSDPVLLPAAEGAVFKKLEVARQILESDKIINIPKLKTHGQMLLTLGVKNLFGCIVGQRKAEWHYNVGLRRELFASLLLDLWFGIRPSLTILDGIVGMDGHGPSNGKPYPYSLLAASENALSMDFYLCKMLGVQLEDFPLWQAAKARDLPECVLNKENMKGDFSLESVFGGIAIPQLGSLALLPNLPFLNILGPMLTSRPIHRPLHCISCGKCVAVCKAGALTLKAKKLVFDYKKCIRCYCCHEMCPVDAIGFKDSFLLKFMRFFSK